MHMQTELMFEGEIVTQVDLLEKTVSAYMGEDFKEDLTGERDATNNPSLQAPLFADATVPITNETKDEFVQRLLRHKVVACIQEQAGAFRNGLTEVLP